MFSPNMLGLNLKLIKAKTVLGSFTVIVNESKCEINYGLIKEKNFTITFCKVG